MKESRGQAKQEPQEQMLRKRRSKNAKGSKSTRWVQTVRPVVVLIGERLARVFNQVDILSVGLQLFDELSDAEQKARIDAMILEQEKLARDEPKWQVSMYQARMFRLANLENNPSEYAKQVKGIADDLCAERKKKKRALADDEIDELEVRLSRLPKPGETQP